MEATGREWAYGSENGDRHLEDSEPVPVFRTVGKGLFGAGTSKTWSQSPFIR
jgi:hypothetical protein